MSTPLALRSTAHWWRRARRSLPSTVAVGVLLPLGYLASLGVGIGRFVGGGTTWLGDVPYAAWLAPGLLAGTAVQTAGVECLWVVVGAVRWVGQYAAQTATPLRPRDALTGHWAYVALRMAIGAALQLAVMAAFGAWRRPTAPLALPAAVLTGASVAAALMAFSVVRTTDGSFPVIQRFVVTPMFLFAGTFFPVGQLPVGLRYAAYATPLYHGVSLCRGLMIPGTPGRLMAVNLAYLVVLAVGATGLAARRYERVLAR